MSKSQLDGGFDCKFFLHINGSNEYINYMIQNIFEHFPGVCLVYRPSSDVVMFRTSLPLVGPGGRLDECYRSYRCTTSRGGKSSQKLFPKKVITFI